MIDHAPDGFSMLEATTETGSPTSCVIKPVEQQTSVVTVITVTTTVHISATITTPQSSCSCSDQQQTGALSSSDSNVGIITVPIVVVFGVIIVIVIVVIGILIWRKTNSRNDALPYDNVSPTTTAVENNL